MVLWLASAGCGLAPDLARSGASDEALLSFAPPREGAVVAPFAHVLLASADGPDDILFVRGGLTQAQLSKVRKGEVSQTLSARRIAHRAAEEPGGWRLIPDEPMRAGELYAVGVLSSDRVEAFDVADDWASPYLERAWPPHDAAQVAAPLVFCDPRGDVAIVDATLTLLPQGPALALASHPADGAASPGSCVFAHGEPTALPHEGWIIPTQLGEGEAAIGLAGGRLVPGDAPLDELPVACEPGEIELPRGCLRVEDDRLVLRPPRAPTLWKVEHGTGQEVRVTRDAQRMVVRGLFPQTTYAIRIESTDVFGTTLIAALDVTTSAPMPHVEISEVYADAVGPEPEQEWIELYNDGAAPAELADYTLADAGGELALPTASLAPGAFALVVGADFDASGELDEPPVPGTPIIVVEEVGTNGLSNQGEPLRLSKGSVVVSRFPGEPTPKQAISVARRTFGAGDGPSNFGRSADGCSPGRPNSVEPEPR